MKAVVAHISYGLGNQLLQFAAGYALSKRLGVPLDLDVSWYHKENKNTAPRELQVTQMIPNSFYRRKFVYSKIDLFQDRVKRILTGSISRYYRTGVPIWLENEPSSEPFNSLSRPVCIAGVPTNFQYFAEELDVLREEFIKHLSTLSDIRPAEDDYAFIHVRLGDKVNSPIASVKFVSLGLPYYTSAIKAYEAKHGPTNWVLCSDDPREALPRLPKGINIEVNNKPRTEFDDFLLMANSKGGVIANSTFSLWGGLLSDVNGGSIIAPNDWWLIDRPPLNMPSNWIVI